MGDSQTGELYRRGSHTGVRVHVPCQAPQLGFWQQDKEPLGAFGSKGQWGLTAEESNRKD